MILAFRQNAFGATAFSQNGFRTVEMMPSQWHNTAIEKQSAGAGSWDDWTPTGQLATVAAGSEVQQPWHPDAVPDDWTPPQATVAITG